MARKKVDTLIFSDVHLSSRVSRANALFMMLHEFECSRLIITGDFLDKLGGKLPKTHHKILEYVEHLKQGGCEVVHVDGNHDANKISPKKQYIWEFNGESYLAIHGHQFDKVHHERPWLSNFGDAMYRCAQILLTHQSDLPRKFKFRNKKWLEAGEVIAAGASAYAHSLGVQHVFCGHTHRAIRRYFPEIDVTYYNSGCWTDLPSTCLTVGEKGVEVHEYY